MSAANRIRYVVTGTLVALEPFLVAGDARPGLDVTPFVDGAGRLTIPGTSLAGVLRAAARSTGVGSELIGTIFGPADSSRASRCEVRDLVLTGGCSELEFRDGVGIDRRHGAAADGFKFDRTMVAAGAEFSCTISYLSDVETEEGDNAWKELKSLIDRLVSGEIRLGSGSTRGAGRVKLREARLERVDLLDASSVLSSITGSLTTSEWEPAKADTSSIGARGSDGLMLRLTWEQVTPVMSSVSLIDALVDNAPMVRMRDGKLRLVLPGTSVKGVLRAQTERVARTLLESDAPVDFAQQLEKSPVGWLFGSTRNRSCVAVGDVFSDPLVEGAQSGGRTLDVAAWEQMFEPTTDSGSKVDDTRKLIELRQRLTGWGLTSFIPTAHVAIDRWTGGASDGRLYSVLEPHDVRWEPIEIRLDTMRLGERTLAAVGLLLLAIDSLARSYGPLGFGGHRGLGSIMITNVELDGTSADRTVAAHLDTLRAALQRAQRAPARVAPIDALTGDECADVRKALAENIQATLDSAAGERQREETVRS